MARFTPDPRGPLIHSRLRRYKGIVIWWQRTSTPVIPPHPDDKSYFVRDLDRTESIAFRELGSDEYDWVVKRRNGIRLEPNDLIPGCEIFIPSLRSLRERGIIRT